jgi:hypothetical protein
MSDRQISLAVVVIVAILVIAVVATRSRSGPSTPPTCGPSGCAVVSLVSSSPPVTVFYGASCSGVHGSWFFNAVEGGGSDALRPSYALRWTFQPSSATAEPSGQIVIAPTDTTNASLTLIQGTLKLKGTRKPNLSVAATGSLIVELAGSASAPTLKFTETGLQQAEAALGMVSPFDVNAGPLVVPIKTVQKLAGC